MAVWNEVHISTMVEKDRIDAEFFQHQYTELDKYVGDGIPLSTIASTVDLQSNGAFRQIFDILNDKGHKVVPYIRSGNVGNFFLNRNELHFISKKAHSLLPKTHTKFGDILMARKGKIGGATLITEDDINLNSNDNVVNIRIKDSRFIPGYFVAFWNSKFGLSQVQRLSTGNVQPWLSMKQVRMLKTVLLDYTDQQEVSEIVSLAYSKSKLSKSLYTQAEDILEKELGLDQLVLKKDKTYETTFSEMVDTFRGDAEYFNPTTREIVRRITSLKHLRLKECFSVVNGYPWSSTKFLSKGLGEPVVRIRNIRPGQIKNNSLTTLDKVYVNRLQVPKAKKDDIVVGMDGIKYFYSAIITDECYVNQRVAHLSPKPGSSISSIYASFIMNSRVGQHQLLRDMTVANTVGHITNNNIRDLVIPFPSKAFHDKVTDLVSKSFTAKQESELLLEQAKMRVEQLIEGAVKQ
ncbi:hypothetical protein ABWK29_23170 [Priestia megaterium]|uniref:hypothetical protein n=1 Tax=Priestia megaterium TaxID=1404 RepID=UPI003397ACA6